MIRPPVIPRNLPPASAASGRVHALDGLRASALLVGVVFHSALAHVMPSGEWAVGVAVLSLPLWRFVHYTHDFRMPLFFVLAGFFAVRVVARRGLRAYVRDRAIRIGLVFAVLLIPMKYLINLPWIAAGLKSGRLVLPPDVGNLPLTALAVGSIQEEVWPAIRLTHLWFLYVLFIISIGFVSVRWAVYRIAPQTAARRSGLGRRVCSALCANWLAPLWLALPFIPLLAATPRGVLESPDRSFVVEPVAGVLFGFRPLAQRTDLLSQGRRPVINTRATLGEPASPPHGRLKEHAHATRCGPAVSGSTSPQTTGRRSAATNTACLRKSHPLSPACPLTNTNICSIIHLEDL